MAAVRRILVTGANKGVGFAIVQRILVEHEDTEVLLGSRNEERGAAALQSLPEKIRERAHLIVIDVSSEDSVGKAVAHVKEKFGTQTPPLFALVNNAGTGYYDSTPLSQIFQTNVHGLWRTVENFKPLLHPNGRIVNVTSAAGPKFVSNCSPENLAFFSNGAATWVDLEKKMSECVGELEGKKSLDGLGLGLQVGSLYGLSKAFANALTIHQASLYPSFLINSCTPGWIHTDMTKNYLEKEQKSPEDVGMKTPEQGAHSTLHLLFGDAKGTGWFFGSDAKRSPFHRYRDPKEPEYDGKD